MVMKRALIKIHTRVVYGYETCSYKNTHEGGIWYMGGIWVVYGWYMGGIWVVYGWYMGGIWVVYGWYMGGIWVVYGWYMGGIWLCCIKYQGCEERCVL